MSTSAAPRRYSLTGVGLVARVALRRSRWFWMLWVVALWSTIAATLSAYRRVIPKGVQGERVIRDLAANSTMRAMLGPPFRLDDAGGFTMWRVGGFVAMCAAAMAALGVIRATRAEEEDGRTELVRAGAIDRHAPLVAAVGVAGLASIVLALAITLTLGLAAPPWGGAVAAGLGIGLTAMVWAGAGAVAAQVTSSARAARGIAMAVLGAAYVLRAIADGFPNDSAMRKLDWLSPLDWAALSRPYARERWWVLVLLAALAAALVATAFALENRRDHGSGLRATRPGPRTAGPRLASAWGLAWRLQRASVIGWIAGVALMGLAIGSLAASVDRMLADAPDLAERFRVMGHGAERLRDAFYVAMLAIVVVVVALHALQLFSRLGREEDQGRADTVLATATTRTTFAASHLVIALVSPTVLLGVAGLTLGVAQAVSEHDAGATWTTFAAALVDAPAVWFVAGLAMAVHGWVPRLDSVLWGVVGWSLFVVWVGALLELPHWVLELTPFAPLPARPVEPMTWTPIVVETLLAALLCALGLVGYRRRDLAV